MIDLVAKYPIPVHETWGVVDTTKLNTLMSCDRQYFFEYMLGWQSTAPNNHTKFGEAWHTAQEHILLNGYTPDAVVGAYDKFLTCYREEFPESTDELYEPKTPDRAKDALIEYVARYPHDLNEYKVLYTEIAGTVPITPEKLLYFRMDSILQEQKPDGRYGSFEHKTKGGSIYDRYWLQYPMSIQVGTYNHVLYCLYPEGTFGVEVNVAGFLKTKFDFQRMPYRLSLEGMQVWMDTVNYYMDHLEAECGVLLEKDSPSEKTMLAFPPCPTSCDKWFGCPYLDFCTAWANPLQRCDEPPMGFEVRFWDPREKPASHKIDLGGKDVSAGTS